ncbi:MAG TPA: type II secretion system protein [Burkholderiaceae bacterium]|jgi:general secretion pathway protein G|nr:type II secretion system protein [Burkholderiaceae bacterium]
MRSRQPSPPPRGFTLIELVVTLALVGVMAMVAVPLYEVTAIRMKEMELRSALRQIRTALDAYKDAADSGKIQKDPSDSGYPPTLKVLVDGVDAQQNAGGLGSVSSMASTTAKLTTPNNGTTGSSTSNGTTSNSTSSDGPSRLMFLRQIPRDPFTPDPSLPPEEQWDTRSYGSPPSDPQPGKDVYDVMSKSTTVGSNAIAYKDW